jgi:MoxR-like ATPase
MIETQTTLAELRDVSGRTVVIPEDVQEMAPFVLRHRLILRQGTPEQVLDRALADVPVPDVRAWSD